MNASSAIDNPDPVSGQPADAVTDSTGGPRADRLGRVGLLLIIVGLVGALVWAATAPLDEGVPTHASVVVDTKRKAVQHLQGGIVREVLVREGEQVREGQVLIRLDDAATRANLEAVRQRYLAMRAMESRLLAEQSGSSRIDIAPDLRDAASDPLIARHLARQQEVFASRRASLAADLQVIEESIRGQEASIRSYSGMLESRGAQRRLLSEQLENIRDLVSDGYAPRNQLLELQRQVVEIDTAMTDLKGNVERARQSIAELRQRAVARRQEQRKETDLQLAEVSREVQAEEGKVKALADDLQRIEIRSPATGQVVGLAYQTVGGVIPPGQKLMDIVPEKEALLLEAQVPPHLIDAVGPGLLTDVRFSTFAHSPQLVAEGRVVSVSADLLSEQTPQGALSYFLTRVQLTPKGMEALGRHQIQPGMPAEVIIRTGERTVLTYLLHPLTRRVAASMKEQ